MKVGIIGAMEQEVVLLRDNINHRHTHTYAGGEISTGTLFGVDIALLKSGIGKVSAAMGTTLLLEHYHPNVVINTGSAGGLAPTLNVGDIVVSDEVRYHDVDLTAFGYLPGQMSGCPSAFFPDNGLIELAEHTLTQLNFHAIRGLICSGDSFINSTESLMRIRQHFPHVTAVEMEAAAIAHVCHLFNTPFVVVRAISDVADKVSHLDFKQFLSIAAQQSTLMVESMVAQLAQ